MIRERNTKEILCERIKAERMKLGLSQAKFAELLSVKSSSTIGNWETGASFPDYDKLALIADCFGVTVDYLLGRTSRDTKEADIELDIDEDARELMRRFGCCDDIGQDAIMSCVDFHYNRCTKEPEMPDHVLRRREDNGDKERLFLSPDKDSDYEEMKGKLDYLRKLRRSKRNTKSFMDITRYLWEIGYGSEICLGFVLDIFGKGLCDRVPSYTLYKDIEAFLKGQYRVRRL